MYSTRNGTEIAYRMDRTDCTYKSDDPNEHIFEFDPSLFQANCKNVSGSGFRLTPVSCLRE
jgi:hypothetical protein